MLKRTISSVVGIALLAILFWATEGYPFLLNVVIALAAALAVFEFFGATGQRKRVGITILSCIYAMVLPFLPYLATITPSYSRLFIGVVLTLAYGLFLFVYMIVRYTSIEYQEITATLVFVVMIAASLAVIPTVYETGNRLMASGGLFHMIILLAAAWTADIGAYQAGTLFGKHKLIPAVSPKKTVEGLIGGIVFDVGCLLLIGFLIQTIGGATLHIEYGALALIGLAGSLISVVGDLTFSVVKRGHNVKDYGKIMPGHGGLLDRIDSLIFVAPAVYVLLLFFPPLVG